MNYSGASVPLYWQEYTLTQTVLVPTWPLIILFGMLANITNIVVFLKTGVKDNVTTLLLSLSVSDLTFLVLITPSMCTFIIVRFAPDWPWPFDRIVTIELLYWPAFTFYDFSSFISVWLGVIRCACVAMPLHFKSIFTKTRTVKIVVALFVICVSLRAPVMSILRLAWKTDPRTNSTFLTIAKVNRKSMTFINDVLNRNTLLYINFIVMVTCVSVLSYKLYEASRERKAYTSTSSKDSSSNCKASETPDGSRLSSKDVRVIQSVVLVCSIFIMSQMPFLSYSTARLIHPEFSFATRLRYLFVICTTISRTCAYLNASVNIFVYYNYNSKYRAVLLSMLNV